MAYKLHDCGWIMQNLVNSCFVIALNRALTSLGIHVDDDELMVLNVTLKTLFGKEVASQVELEDGRDLVEAALFGRACLTVHVFGNRPRGDRPNEMIECSTATFGDVGSMPMCHVALRDNHYYWYEVAEAAVAKAAVAVDEDYERLITDCEVSIRLHNDAVLAKAIAERDHSDSEIAALSERFADQMLTRLQIGACLKKGMSLISV